MISVLALDISKSRTGWAVGTPEIANGTGVRPGWGVFEPTPGPHKEIETMGRFAELLTELHTRYNFSNICWEAIFVDTGHFQFRGTEAQLEMQGILKAFCHANKIHGSHVAISAWRAEVYGSSRCPPQHRVNGKAEEGYWKDVATRWAVNNNYLVTWHDEAEALAILYWALTMLDQGFAARITPMFRRANLDAMHKRGIHAEE